jgi:hypothetical protein
MSKPIKLVYGVCYTNPNFVSNTVKALLEGLLTPTDIVIADYGLVLANSLRKKDNVSVIKTPNYGMLSSLYAILEKYGTAASVHIILVDEATNYMPHLAPEYLNASPEMFKHLQSRIPAGVPCEGAAFGLSGILFTEDTQKQLDSEFDALLDDSSLAAAKSDSGELSLKRTLPTILKDTSTVDILEFSGSIYFKASYLEGFKDAFFSKTAPAVSYDRFQATVFLSNFLAKKHIFRVNVCHLTNNRFIMDRIGCFDRLQKYSPTDYLPVMNTLYTKGELHICKEKF